MTNSPLRKPRLIRQHALLATLLLSLNVSQYGSLSTFASGDHHDHEHREHTPTANFSTFDESPEHGHDDHGHAHQDNHSEEDEHGHDSHEGEHVDGHSDHHNQHRDEHHDDHSDHHGHGGHDDHADGHSDENKTTIDAHQLELAGVKTAIAGPQTLQQSEKLFGVISAIDAQIYRLNAPYPSLVENIHVNVGDQVKKGQVLATLQNVATLQSYTLKSPNAGEITARPVNAGERVDMTPLLIVTDLSTVWVEMSAFPESIEKLVVGQSVRVNDLHKHDSAIATLSYIAPQMTGGHIARARATIANPNGHWRPGMHVKAAVTTATHSVPLAVSISALQNFREQSVVFSRDGNTFEARPLELGERDDAFIEVLGGLEAGVEYVIENSFLIKADILKSGAAHVH